MKYKQSAFIVALVAFTCNSIRLNGNHGDMMLSRISSQDPAQRYLSLSTIHDEAEDETTTNDEAAADVGTTTENETTVDDDATTQDDTAVEDEATTNDEADNEDEASADDDDNETCEPLSDPFNGVTQTSDDISKYQNQALNKQESALELIEKYDEQIEKFVPTAQMDQINKDQQKAKELQIKAQEAQQKVDELVKKYSGESDDSAIEQVILAETKTESEDQALVQLYMSWCNDQIKCHNEDFYTNRLAEYSVQQSNGMLSAALLETYAAKMLAQTTNASKQQVDKAIKELDEKINNWQ